MALVAVRVKHGDAFSIYVLEENGACDLLEFLERIDECELARIYRYWVRTADIGLIRNPDQSKAVGDGIYEFRTYGGVRVFYFLDVGKVVVCANGYVKKKDKIDPVELAKTNKLREKYRLAKANSTLEFEERPI
jgi:putative component of toxin-antitoxin plasmid stabilization module